VDIIIYRWKKKKDFITFAGENKIWYKKIETMERRGKEHVERLIISTFFFIRIIPEKYF
jgi:hypothetical protein